MSHQDFPSLPEGYVLTRRGGRPPKHARDVAVWMMHHKMTETDGCTWNQFFDAASEMFLIQDEANMRKRIRQAKKVHDKSVIIDFGEWLFLVEIAKVVHGALIPGSRCWGWAPGMREAHKMKVTAAEVSSPIGHWFYARCEGVKNG